MPHSEPQRPRALPISLGKATVPAAEAFAQTGELSRLAIMAAGDLVWEWDVNTGFVQVGNEETNFATWVGTIHPEDVETFLVAVNDHLEGASQRFEAEYRLNDRWVNDRGLAERVDGQVVRLVGLRTDIHDRRIEEESLLSAVQSLEAAQSVALVASITFDPATGVQTASPEFRRLLKNRSVTLFEYPNQVVEEDRERVALALEAAVHQLKRVHVEHRLRVGESVKVVRLTAEPRDGKVVASFWDVTEQSETDAALRKLDTVFKAAIEAGFDAFLLLESVRNERGRVYDFEFRQVNRKSEALIGAPIEQVIGRRTSMVVSVEKFKRYFVWMRRAIHAGRPAQREVKVHNTLGVKWYLARVVPVGEYVAVVISDITERKQHEMKLLELNEKLVSLASTDALTGVCNRREFQNRLKTEIERADRYGTALSLVIVDIDNFKTYNDRFGHQFGDDVLKEFANIISQTARISDIVARYGGEEFAVILPMTNVDEAVAFSARVRQRLHITEIGIHRVQVTGSFGCAQHRKGDRALEDLISRADSVQYVSKKTGKDKVTRDQS